MSNMIGDLIDHYRILELVGGGAMGVVYKALDVNLERVVAVKVMSAEARTDPEFVERFRQEARLQGALNHPNVTLLFDYFVHDGAPVAVMEFIDGWSLAQLIRRRGLVPAHEIIPIFKQALRGVAAAHRAGIIHRDLKPANLMVTKDGIVKVMDFGIAKRQGTTGATKASTSVGSPLYMAPEQILGRAVDCRTDVYALGVTLYELLSGKRPFNPRGKVEYLILNAHVNDPPEPPTVHCRDIPQPVVDTVMRALAKDPGARFQSVDEFMHALPDLRAPDAVPNAVASRMEPSDTVALEYSPPTSENSFTTGSSSGTMVFEYAASTRREPHDSMAYDYSARTLRLESDPHRSAPARSAAAPPAAQGLRAALPGLMRLRRADTLLIVAVLIATLVVGAHARHSDRSYARQASTAIQAPTSTEPAASPPPEIPSSGTDRAAAADVSVATALPPAATTFTTTTAPAQQDLSGTWRGEYLDASGKQLLRVISLSISRVQNDGGIEGTLQYEAGSGDGECKLHPRGSTYSVGEQRLQLSPEGCSLHYPRELGVPLDFDGVNPQTNTLRDGRIETPSGEVIRVMLRRVNG